MYISSVMCSWMGGAVGSLSLCRRNDCRIPASSRWATQLMQFDVKTFSKSILICWWHLNDPPPRAFSEEFSFELRFNSWLSFILPWFPKTDKKMTRYLEVTHGGKIPAKSQFNVCCLPSCPPQSEMGLATEQLSQQLLDYEKKVSVMMSWVYLCNGFGLNIPHVLLICCFFHVQFVSWRTKCNILLLLPVDIWSVCLYYTVF